MSDTPITDAYCKQILEDGLGLEYAATELQHFAEKLERELEETKEQLRCCNVHQLTTAAELAEANARLDWLDTVECGIQHKSYGEYWHYIGKGFPKAREVIDAAMKEKNT